MERCVIYSRVSSDHQDFERQVDELLKYAKGKYTIDRRKEVFAEKVSVYKKKGKELKDRPAFDRMKKYIEENNIKTILMWEISRLARNTVNALVAIEEFRHKGVGIYFYKERLLSTEKKDKTMITFLAEFAERERDDIVERAISGQRKSASRGTVAGFYGRSIPYGFKSVKPEEGGAGILTIDDEEAEVIRKIFNWAEGKGEPEPVSTREIAKRLNKPPHLAYTRWRKLNKPYVNSNGIARQRTWKPNNISLILRNPIYKGVRSIKVGEEPTKDGKTKRIVEEKHLPNLQIVETAQWDMVQNKIRKKDFARNNAVKHQYLLRNKLICGIDKCGRSLGAFTEYRYGERSYYRCYGSHDIDINCKNGQFSGFALDEGVYALLFQHRGLFTKMREEALATVDIISKQEQIQFNLNEIENERRNLKGMMQNYNRGDYRDAFGIQQARIHYNRDRQEPLRNIKECELEVKRLEQEIEDFNSLKNTNADTFLKEIDLYETDDFERKVDFVKKYINKVVYLKVTKSLVKLNDLIWDKIERRNYFERIDSTFYKEGEKWQFHSPDGRDNFAYVEIFAFGSPVPVKGIIANRSKLYSFADDMFQVTNEGVVNWKDSKTIHSINTEKKKLLKTKIELEKARSIQSLLNNK
jgi:DNA invertase Pin-like site-specific DNA recombinase